MTQILDGSYTGYTGSIQLDEIQRLSTVPISSLHQCISSVRQDIQLFSQNIMFNLTLDNKNISRKADENLQRPFYVREQVMLLKESAGSEMREGGGDVSVGEGQLTRSHE